MSFVYGFLSAKEGLRLNYDSPISSSYFALYFEYLIYNVKILSLNLTEQALGKSQAFILAFASGTFIYVAIIDILPSEFGDDTTKHEKYKKYGVFLVGLTAVTILMLLFNDHEEAE